MLRTSICNSTDGSRSGARAKLGRPARFGSSGRRLSKNVRGNVDPLRASSYSKCCTAAAALAHSSVSRYVRPRVRTRKAVAVRHLHGRKRAGVHDRVLRYDVRLREDERDDGIRLIVAERAGSIERHRALYVVEKRGRVGPVALHGLDRGLRWTVVDKRAAPSDQLVADLRSLQLLAVAGHASGLV